LRDSLPFANLKYSLVAEKDQNISAQDLAKLADDDESNFWADGRYNGQSVTVPRISYWSPGLVSSLEALGR